MFGAWRYDGVKWGAVSGVSGGGSAGDITAVLAGAGLSGGGTEGDVSIALASSPALTGNPTAPTPAKGDNDTSIATTEFVATAIAQAANQTYYYDLTDNSDIATYKKLLLAPSLNAESNMATVCTGTSDVLMASFATDSGVPGAINYPAGSAYRRLYGKVSGGSAKFRLQILSRSPGGVETIVRDEYSPAFSSTTPAMVEWLATPLGGTILPTDRLVAKVYGQRQTGSPTNVTVTLHCEGTNNASQMQTTIPMGSQALVGVTPPLTMNGGTISLTSPLPIANGGTGSSTGNAGPYLPLTGGAANPVTGVLELAPAGWVVMRLRKPAAGNGAQVASYTGANARWSITLGDASAESGSNAGSNFAIERYNDAGTFIDQPLAINRATGNVAMPGEISFGLAGKIANIANYTQIYSGSTTALILGVTSDPANYHRNTAHYFQDIGGTATWARFNSAGTANVSGAWTTISDAAAKEHVLPYSTGLDALLELQPVKFSYRVGFGDDGSKTRIGLIAQQVAPYIPEIVGKSGDLMTLEPGNLIYCLLNAVKELAARIAALEAA